MSQRRDTSKKTYQMEFDVATIKHLGLQMYSTMPPVIGELIANSWDANATKVEITIPDGPIDMFNSEIVIRDNGIGMSDEDVRNKYLIIGRDRRADEGYDITSPPESRPIMGRKGIGKFSTFGIAKEIVVETVKSGEVSHFRINYDDLLNAAGKREILLPPLPATNTVSQGTKITLKRITKFRTRSIPIDVLRRGLARRFAVIGAQYNFEVVINDEPISPEDRDLKRLLAKDMDSKPYIWEYNEVEIKPETGWTVSGWIGALERTTPKIDNITRGIVLMARGKLVQEPFVFDAVVGQQYALSYLIGELHTEFVDQIEDTIGTTRNSLVWDTDANTALKAWGQKEVNKIALSWSDKRRKDNEQQLQQNQLYLQFRKQADETSNKRALKLADQLIRQTVRKTPTANVEDAEPIIQTCLDFIEFNTFWEIAEELTQTDVEDIGKLLNLFREWQIVEAKEMARVTKGRINTIEKLHHLIETNALEVPTLHAFLKEFPWVIDPRWTLVADEKDYTELLRDEFPNDNVDNKRIDFLCVREGTHLIVVEIKRPKVKASTKELDQITEYVSFMRDYVQKTSDPNYENKEVIGYLLCGDLVNTYQVVEKRKILENSQIYIRRYIDLLNSVKKIHSEFLERYDQLRKIKNKRINESNPRT